MSDWLAELREAHTALAGEGLYTTGGGSEAWNRLSALIETGPPVGALDALPAIGDEADLSVMDQRKEVLRALYEAATSGNVTAVLKWLDLHRNEFDRPEAPAVASADADGSEAAVEVRSHSTMIGELEDAFSGGKE